MTPRPEPTPAPPPEFELALRLAREAQGGYAVEVLSRMVDPTCADSDRQRIAAALAQVGRICEQGQDLEAAVAALELAVTLADWADLHCHFGQLLAQSGRRAEAREAFDRALALNPRYRAAGVERALLDAREGRIAQAMETLRLLASETALVEPRVFEEALEHLGHADFEDAGALLRRALHARDAWLEGRLRAYQEMVDQGEQGAALQILREAVGERSNYPDLHLLLGGQELRMGAADDAMASFAQALELNPDYHTARVAFAQALERSGDTRQALGQLELVLAEDPWNREARVLHDRLTARRPGVRAVV